jgi:hypothetical protein
VKSKEESMADEKKVPQMLVSFINSVAVMVDGRVFFTHGVICEEIFGAKTEISENDVQDELKTTKDWLFWKKKNPVRASLDFPLYIKVISLGDGKPLSQANKMIVKYNNISAIMEL